MLNDKVILCYGISVNWISLFLIWSILFLSSCALNKLSRLKTFGLDSVSMINLILIFDIQLKVALWGSIRSLWTSLCVKCLECSVAETTMMLVGVLLVLYSPIWPDRKRESGKQTRQLAVHHRGRNRSYTSHSRCRWGFVVNHRLILCLVS